MIYNIPKKLKEENKLCEFSGTAVFIKDVAVIGACAAVFGLFSRAVSNDILRYIYWAFAAICCFYLSRSAKNSNPGLPRKQRWEAIQMMLLKDPSTYYALNPVQKEEIINATGGTRDDSDQAVA